jgi:hypothetical protein
MSGLIPFFVVSYVVLVVVVLVAARQLVDPAVRPDEYAKLAGLGVTAVSGIMVFIASLFGIKASRDLEALKGGIVRATEGLKAVLSKKIDGYHTLTTAATYYYRTLSDLERGKWDDARFQRCEDEMAKVEANVGLLPGDEAFVNLWRILWQKGRVISELASTSDHSTAALQKIWQEHCPQFGDLIGQLQKAERDVLTALETTAGSGAARS